MFNRHKPQFEILKQACPTKPWRRLVQHDNIKGFAKAPYLSFARRFTFLSGHKKSLLLKEAGF
jgi:hypothetical protein